MPLPSSRAGAALGALVVALLAVGWWDARPTPSTADLATSQAAAEAPPFGLEGRATPALSSGGAPSHVPPWPERLVSSRYARVSSDVFAEYGERYAVEGWPHRAKLQKEASPDGRSTPKQEKEAQRAAGNARNAGSMISLRKLYLSVASYRRALLGLSTCSGPTMIL